jgi:16S rRNA (guanine527-N7)-methyltransferase
MNELLIKYNKLLVEKNAVMNLTAHKTEEESLRHNVEDSLLFVDYFRQLGRISCLDIGSGGGCPAVPLAASCPDLNITMLDSTRKKIDFLNDVVTQLPLKNAHAIHARIEDFAKSNRERFDLVTARGVAELPTLIEYALPFLRVGGTLAAFKGSNVHAEIEKSARALAALSGKVLQILDKSGDKERYLLLITKIAETPAKYPRNGNLPRLKPL